MQTRTKEGFIFDRRHHSFLNSWHIPSEKNHINTLKRRFNKRKLDIQIEISTHITEAEISKIKSPLDEIYLYKNGNGVITPILELSRQKIDNYRLVMRQKLFGGDTYVKCKKVNIKI